MSRSILLKCLCVLMAVLALAEAGRQRRQLINAIVGAALGSSGYGQPYYGGGYGGYNQGYGNYGGGRPSGYGGYNQGYNRPYSYNQQQGYYGGRPTNYYG
ncbi:prisilkin-39-like isoform X2 [Daphnia pulicaria]|uniref:prisilkin-39-like isoform X2 n=1 Tax=Daphnia pulicaria TaxID=35523 RepID=UPI001EEB12FA|nr:prisilkin-39-like isoform X2 [Daphnia pulicaria]